MALTLKNENIELLIETAAEKYIGSRFDWNGTIIQAKYKGIPLLSEEKLPFHKNPKIYGRGLHNEFGIKNCIGYDEIKEGEYFPKIGTGWLKKDSKPYFFYTQYELKRLNFSFEKVNDAKAIFICDSGKINGWSYKYIKTIELTDGGFSITYNLLNTGDKNLSTTEYVHNFLLPGKHKTYKHLSVDFAWSFSKDKLLENVKSESLLIKEDSIDIINSPKTEFFLGGIFQARKTEPSEGKPFWKLIDKKDKISIEEKDSFTPIGFDLWGHKGDISPEVFTSFSIEPKQSASWKREYFVKSI